MPSHHHHGDYPINHFFQVEGEEKIKDRRFKLGVFK